ncbi:zinc finger and BTB domain-containing protein 7B-like [Acipenser oxyrinchus oxyrinchus]|uniref:Zinc finger and BTB domain-containing protein 7B-like n=1 Tax=Acipenser oxyrinchus oxyrinchus TaxID=40147 RepID=A0AAD8CQE1_ACIOX|nr:zinc finger and BTB domain-containing protein 7B-like [Acipenser oxyrinchus oxyrinchus]
MGTSEDGLIGIPFPEHSSEILCRLNEQRRAGLLCDVTIKTQGLEYRSHRAVLAAVSQYFRKLFTTGGGRSGGFGGGGGPRSVCQLDCVDPEALAALLEFAYTATLTIRTSSMRGVLRAARLLEIQCVTDACLDILRSSGEEGEEEEEEEEEAAKEESKRDLGLEGEGRYETGARFPQGFPHGFPDGFVRENGRPASEEEGTAAPQRQVPTGGGRGGRGGRSRGSPRRPRKRVDNRLPLPLLHPALRGAALDYSLRERERERERERALGSSVVIPRAPEDLDREEIEDYEGGRGERNGFSFNESMAYNGWRFRTAADHERLSVEEEEREGEEEEEEEEEEVGGKGFAHPGPQLPEPAGLPFSFSSAASPQLPDKAVRKRKSQTPQQCPVCQKIIHGAGKLPRHMRTHTGEKPFQCGTCGVRFTRNDKLKIHMRKHTGERPYCCPHCPARFLHSYDLKNHLSLHSGDRPFECTLCHKAFAREDHLQRHLKGQNCLEVRTRKPRRAGGGGGGGGAGLALEESQPPTLLQQGYPAPLLSRSPLPSFADGRLWSPGTSTPPSPTPNGPWEGPDSSEEPL